MLRRVRRIYPPYLLSVAFWIATRIIKWKQTGDNDLARFAWYEWAQNLTLTQWISLVFNPSTYAARNPTNFVVAYWSLGYEEQFYLVMGAMMLLAVRVRMSVLGMTSLLMAVGFGVNMVWPEVACGFFIEYWSLFAIGVLVFHRLCRMESRALRRTVDAFLVAVFAASVWVRWFSGAAWAADAPGLDALQRAEMRVVYGELAIAAGFALLLIVMRPASGWIGRQLWFKPLAALGAITFSLYLIHQFNLSLVSKVGNRFFAIAGLDGASETIPWHTPWLIVQVLLHIGLAGVFWFFCERPFLNKSLGAGPEAAKR